MNERDMVMDTLSCVKASVGSYAKGIVECCDLQLRQTIQQMRNSDEQFQYELYKIAEEKGYYIPSPKAMSEDCSTIKTKLSNSLKQCKTSVNIPAMNN